ncbi:D-amino-acid oxidase [Schizosaccharomyces pombe]|uniref:D-amino-acid oxidase n=1 Tax=Schizosaccharomyces pombe (strain 972 / ATCC 24843) TaxID=284812 RepID=OXDA_SCHPO|nr:putative D-amino acid oxidase [Schizosaccharomyces pombe]Q9Y7N4.1 RecName: Full=D-amino-acid oxidase; Short=DAAO; Short=DAMOX; Short=DAO [Schizosaccharomyces pombe 972h-]CAB40174.1 D-amino acid oxidase (predicted) [Schizosaccharomyces pombe]CCN80316.1 D-amino oxidase [synthetic construct]|eukprot:NP_001342883.1 putative D-amino acid oxidase [Schizosaccharomyces pombe]
MTKENKPRDIVIVGAGVIGLTTAWILSDLGLAPRIKVIAKYTPEDRSVEYTSPWAGANFCSISATDDNALRWDKITYHRFAYLAKTRPEAGIRFADLRELWEYEPKHDKIRSWNTYVRDFKVIPEKDLPGECIYGHKATTFLINAPHYLNYMYKLLIEAGVEFEKKELSHIKETVEETPEASVVFNCTGLWASKLGGVEDPDVYPTRGHVVLVKAPHVTETRILNGKNSDTYIIPRPLNGGVICGGFMQPGNWDREIHPEDTLDILKRTSALMPELFHGKGPEGAEIIQECVGFRPSRKGGARVELDVVPGTSVPLVHDYGASGTGYQAGYGMALDSVMLALPKIKLA